MNRMSKLRPVVFLPGFPGSSLELPGGRKIFPPSMDDLLNRKKEIFERLEPPDDPETDDGVRVRSPIRYSFQIPLFDLGKEAQSLYDLLEDLGYDTEKGSHFIPVGWDWRLPVDHPPTLNAVEEAIRELQRFHNQKITILVHSTGGLVLRALLESRPEMVRLIERVIALGVPWVGTIKSFTVTSIGEELRLGPITFVSRKESRRLVSRTHAAWDLMPPRPEVLVDDEGPIDLFTARGEPTSPLVERSWMPNDEDLQRRAIASLRKFGRRSRWFEIEDSLAVTNVVGWGVTMETHCELVARKGTRRAPWFDLSDDGDGTVPRRSAAWLSQPSMVDTLHIPIGWFGDQVVTQKHSQLWNSPPARSLIGSLLTGGSREPHVWASADGDDAIDRRRRIRIRLVASDQHGNPLPEARAHVRLPGAEEAEAVFESNTRATISLGRTGLRPNIGTRFLRFEVRFTWSEKGERRQIDRPLIVEV